MTIDDGSWYYRDPETGEFIYKKKDDSWGAKLSKWFSSLIYLGGIEYVAEEAGAAAAGRVSSAIGFENPGAESIELQAIEPTEHVQVQPDLHVQVERPPIVTHARVSTSIIENPAFEPEILPIEPNDVIPSTSTGITHQPPARYNPDSNLIFDESGVDRGVSLEDTYNYEGPIVRTSTPKGKLPARFNFRKPFNRDTVNYGTEDLVVEERPGWLAKIKSTIQGVGKTRTIRYNKLVNQVDRISMVELTENSSSVVGGEEMFGEEVGIDDMDENVIFDASQYTPSTVIRQRFLAKWNPPEGQNVRLHPGGFAVEEEGVWNLKPFGPGLGVTTKFSRKRKAPSSSSRPKPPPKPKPKPKPPSPIGPGKEVKVSVSQKGVVCKKTKRKCVKKRKGKCIKWKLRCTS
ncbi:L2 protein [Papillomaviridae sp. Haddock_c6033]|nr:L2 protein [Papillomaviridae sp. Haddock_c6033]